MLRPFGAPTKYVSAIALAVSLAAAPSEASAQSALEWLKKKLRPQPTYPVITSGYWVKDVAHRGLIDWIDNDRIIFVGGSYEGWDHNKSNPTALYVFDVKSRTVAKLSDVAGYCFKPTEIRYTLKRTPDAVVIRVIKRGEPAPETEITRPVSELRAEGEKSKARKLQRHPLYCGGYSPRELAGENWDRYKLKRIYPLLEGHGYLDFFGNHPRSGEPPFDTEPARWFPPNGAPPIDLPMQKRAIARVSYSEWKGAYILRGWLGRAPPLYQPPARNERWPAELPLPIWLLKPDGSVESHEIPYSNWIENYNRILPTQAGYVVTKDVNTQDAGLHIVVGKDLVRLVGGSTTALTVSPDGCGVAVAITTDFNNRNGGLKVIEVCGVGK